MKIVQYSSNNQGAFPLILLAVATMVFVAVGVYWVAVGTNNVAMNDKATTTPTPTPDPYEGWQTYTNEEYGISFQYPDKWILDREINKPQYDFLLVTNFSESYSPKERANFSFSIKSTAVSYNIETLSSTYSNLMIGQKNVDDVSYELIEWVDDMHNMHQDYISWQRQYVVERNKYTYVFFVTADSDSEIKTDLSEMLDEIVKTVRFE